MSGKKRDGVYFFYGFSVYPQRHMLFELNAVLMQSIFASFVVSFSVFLVHHHDVVSCTHITTLLRFRFMQCGHHEHALKVYQIEVGSSFALYLSCSASLLLLRLLWFMINNRKKGTDFFFSIRRRIISTCSNNKRRSPSLKALLLYFFPIYYCIRRRMVFSL